MSEEVEAIRQTFRVALTLSGLAFSLTYWLAERIGFNHPLQAGLLVTLVCLVMLAMAILVVVLAQRFCEVLEVEEPQRPSIRPVQNPGKSIFTSVHKQDGFVDLYLHRIYREVAPGDRSYIRKGGLNPNRQSPGASGSDTIGPSSVSRSLLSPRVEPFRSSTVLHPKPHREPRT